MPLGMAKKPNKKEKQTKLKTIPPQKLSTVAEEAEASMNGYGGEGGPQHSLRRVEAASPGPEAERGKAERQSPKLRLHGEAPVLVTRTMLGSHGSLGSFQCSLHNDWS